MLLDHAQGSAHPSRPPDSEIRAQLDRIVASKIFAASERLRRFLIWTVEQVLLGDIHHIKQYTIGREVFDRRADFDPRTDSIVRTEAQRLRRKLSQYYRANGSSDPILLSFETGSYVPVFRKREETNTAKRKTRLEPVSITKRRPAVAVLPFSNLTGFADQDYFCRGIAESIQERLANSHTLRVISSLSAFRFGDQEQDRATIGRELGVNTIVEGSVQLVGSRIRVHAKAGDVISGTYIWARVFDREMRDLFSIQDEIAQAVTNALLEQEGLATVGPTAIPVADAYRLYLRGRYEWNKVTVEGCEHAVRCFLRAISVAPEYAPSYAALAEAYHWLIFFGVRSPSTLVPITRRLALQALRLDRNCPEAYIVLAVVTAAFEWEWEDAEAFFRRGLDLRPNYVPGYLQRAFCRTERGALDESRRDIDKTLELDPLSARAHRGIGFHLYLLRDFANAIASFDRALELGPDIENTHYFRGLALLQAGRPRDAVAAITQSLTPATEGARLGALAAAYAAAGSRPKAEEMLRRLHHCFRSGFASPIAFVHAYANTDQTSKALDWLERAADQRYTGMVQIKLDPLFDPLREESRFQAVLKRTKLA
ncbi:MAG: hypothetical protein JO319_00065 [Acidobacteriaceae bacterium]|nr:hypothetical protein [Acidobacteriaceae bacterium]